MADNEETLGKFKIEVSVDGKQNVQSDLEAIRAGLKSIEDGFKQAAHEGQRLSDVMKELHGGANAGVHPAVASAKASGAPEPADAKAAVGSSFSDVLAALGNSARKAADSASLFADAVGKAAEAMKSYVPTSPSKSAGSSAKGAAGGGVALSGLHSFSGFGRAMAAGEKAVSKHTPIVKDDTGATKVHAKATKADAKAVSGHASDVRADAKALRSHTPSVTEDTLATRAHSKSVVRLTRETDKAVGHEIKDASGNGTGRFTGLRGFNREITGASRSFRSAGKAGDLAFAAFKRLVGENSVTRDPATGAVTSVSRTGAKGLLHSFDALSKAAKGAAANLQKIAKAKGADGKGAGSGAGAVLQTWFERQLKSMKGSEKSFEALGNIVRRANVGNLGVLNGIAGSLGSLGRIAGMFASGPFGIISGAVGAATAAIAKSKEWTAEGRVQIQDLYRYRKRLDAAGLSADEVDADAQRNKFAYTVLNDDGTVDAKATDAAAHNAIAGKHEAIADSLALFETRGIESPWMTALANQGIDYTKIKDYGTLRKTLEGQYAKARAAGEGSEEMRQWRTLRHEIGSMVTEEDYKAITFEGGEINGKKYEPGTKGFERLSMDQGSKTVYSGHHAGVAEEAMGTSVMIGEAPRRYDIGIEKTTESMEHSLSALANALGAGGKAIDETTLKVKEFFNALSEVPRKFDEEGGKSETDSKYRKAFYEGMKYSTDVMGGYGLYGAAARALLPGEKDVNPAASKAKASDASVEDGRKASRRRTPIDGDYRERRRTPSRQRRTPRGILERIDRTTSAVDASRQTSSNAKPVEVKVDVTDSSDRVAQALGSERYKEYISGIFTDATNSFLQSTVLRG